MDPRKSIFEAVRKAAPVGLFNDSDKIAALDRLLDAFGVAAAGGKRRMASPAGIELIQRFESCARPLGDGRFAAYPDPGSRDGRPWTIGWGSTGPDIGPGTVWTKAECDARLACDLRRFAEDVAQAIGDAPTTQHQFDALVSFHYNTGAIRRATLTKKHKAGDHEGAAREFAKWVRNDGQVMRGLVRRREAEAALYAGTA